MHIGVDIRCLMDTQRTGVGEYTSGLLDAILKIDRENQYWLFYNSHQDVSGHIPRWEYSNVCYIKTGRPNKFFNIFLLFGLIKLDNLVIKNCPRLDRGLKIKNLDYWFSPNINFTSLTSKTKFILTIHDLSFEFLPDCYTLKQRLWHKLLRPKRQCQRADVILTPSENTARDVVAKYGIGREKVSVCYPGVGSRITYHISHITENEILTVKKKYDLPEKFILFLGTIEPRKNVEAVLLAFKETCKLANLQTCGLVIAGAKGWKNENVMRLIENTPGVRYIDYVAE